MSILGMISQIVTFVEIIIETKGKIQVRDTGCTFVVADMKKEMK